MKKNILLKNKKGVEYIKNRQNHKCINYLVLNLKDCTIIYARVIEGIGDGSFDKDGRNDLCELTILLLAEVGKSDIDNGTLLANCHRVKTNHEKKQTKQWLYA